MSSSSEEADSHNSHHEASPALVSPLADGSEPTQSLPNVPTQAEADKVVPSSSSKEDVSLQKHNNPDDGADVDLVVVKHALEVEEDGEDKDGKGKGKGKGKKKAEEKPPMVSFFSLFRFADSLDIFLMVVGSLAAAANGAAMPLFSLIFGRLIDVFSPAHLNNPNVNIGDDITQIALYFLWIGIAVFGLSYLEVACWMVAGERQIRRVRERYLQAILQQEIGWFDVTKSSELSTRIVGDTELMSEALGEKVGNFIHHFATFIAGFVLGFVNGWQLTLVILAVTPLLAIAGGFMARMMSELTKKGQDAYAKAGSVAEECLQAIRTVVMFSGEDKETQRYEANLKDARATGIRKGVANGVGLGVVMLIMFSTYALAFWYGSTLISKSIMNTKTGNNWTGGDVVTVFFSVIFGAFALGQASPNIASFANGRAGAYKIFQVLQRTSAIDPTSSQGEKIENVRGDVEFREVEFRYPSRPEVLVFNGMNLRARAGQKVALVGDSGGGKSTVVGLLERFYDPTAGAVFLDGVDIKTLNVKFLRTQIGLVSQEPNLFATTIYENIAYGHEGVTQDDIHNAARLANVHDFITSLPEAYETQVGEKGVQISGGQKQRIAIARAILRNPRILILDEATSALDTENERIVQEAIDKVMHGRTCFVIAHRLATVRDADVIAFVKDGHIVEQGTHDELIALGANYKRLVDREYAAQQAENEAIKDEGVDPHIEAAHSPVKMSGDAIKKSADTITLSVSSAEVSKPEFDLEKGSPVAESDIPVSVPASRVFGMMRPEAGFLIVGMFGAAINGAIMPLFSIVFAQILKAFNDPDKEEVQNKANFLAGMFVVLAVGSFLGNFLSIFMFNYAGEFLTFRLRRMAFRSIMHQEIGYFDDDKNAVGALTTRLAKEASLVHGMYSQRLGMSFQTLVTLVAGLVIAFVNGWKLTLVVLGCVPFVVASGAIQMKFLQGFGNESKAAYEQAGKIATEAITNVRTVASFSREDLEILKYTRRMEKPMRLGLRRSHVSGLGFGMGQFVMFAAYTLAFWFGGWLIMNGEWKASQSSIDNTCQPMFIGTVWISYDVCVNAINAIEGFAQMMNVFMAVILSAMGVGQAAGFAPDAAKAKVAASIIFETVDRRSKIDVDTKADAPKREVMGDIEFRNVRFSYPTRKTTQVLRGLNLKVPAGKTVALVGGSGAGKSTVICLLERFYDPDEGQIVLDGEYDISQVDLRWLRSQVGLVSQEPVLFGTTIFENLRYGRPESTLEEVQEAAKLANAHDFIMRMPLGYETHVGDKHVQLSGGQKQRVAIARAILRNPRILLLDEATSALDSASQRVVQRALENLMVGRTTIIIAHRLSTVQNADIIVVLKDGRVVEQGTHQQLLARDGHYANLVRRQL
eukprot:TRINITY_DN1297_c0_g1_i1.p1 TRINITY_DN1297_c0_g1~~TRINITY_DN1297_c0_g1_i1.p1  ORF type:complete len:1417 (-),score=461.68 TRINITY_DN1297_c0_g1_i1:319-4464(-)